MQKLFAACAAGFILAATAVEKAPDALKVVFYCDRGVGVDLVGRLMDDCPEFVVTFANGKEIGEGALDGADMVVHSGGSGESQFFGLGEKGVAAEREFVKKGGLYHGTIRLTPPSSIKPLISSSCECGYRRQPSGFSLTRFSL